MIKYFTRTCILVALTLATMFAPTTGKSCNLTSFTLNSIQQVGPDWVTTATLCIGAGVTGFVQGADQLSSTMAAFFYGPAGPALVVTASAPAAITSTFRNCTMVNIPNGGPIPGCISPDTCGPPFYDDIDDAIWFSDFFCDAFPPCNPPCDLGFTCVLTTALCGNVHQDCFVMSFTTNVRPDSIRIVGAEGAGLAFSGCYPNPDMLIDLTSLPVSWGEVFGVANEGMNIVHWSTIMEQNSAGFELLRANPAGEYVKIGEVPSKGDGNEKREYSFKDFNPYLGENLYKVRQIDNDGNTSESEVVVLSYVAPSDFAWSSVGPVPTAGKVTANFVSEKDRALTAYVSNTEGRVVYSQAVSALVGTTSLEIDLSNFAPGVYFLQLAGPEGKLVHKLVKN